MGDFNVEPFRHEHESNKEWSLRKKFLLAHHEKFEERRLLCLASCFINVECYGCTYPAGVMQQLRELTSDILDDVKEYREEQRALTAVQFVKQGESGSAELHAKRESPYESFTKSDSNKHLKTVPQESQPTPAPAQSFPTDNILQSTVPDKKTPRKPANSCNIDFVQSASASFSESVDGSLLEKLKGVRKLAVAVSNIEGREGLSMNQLIDEVQKQAIKLRVTVSVKYCKKSDQQFMAQAAVDFKIVGTGSGQDRLVAKTNAFMDLLSVLSKPYLKLVGNKVIAFDEPPGENYVSTFSEVNSIERKVQEALSETYINEHEMDKGLANVHSDSGNETGDQMIDMQDRLQDSDEPAIKRLKQDDGDNIKVGDQLSGDDVGNIGKKPYSCTMEMDNNLSNFLLFTSFGQDNPKAILVSSAAQNKVPLKFLYRKNLGNSFGILRLGKTVIAKVTEVETKRKTEMEAYSQGLQYLKKFCWTISAKQRNDGPDEELSKSHILPTNEAGGTALKPEKEYEAIPESNVGSKMLKKMGWAGGGMGRDGTGIVEPVQLNSVLNRQGLGYFSLQAAQFTNRANVPQFKRQVNEFFRNYMMSTNQEDIVLAPEFTKAERAVIHNVCTRLDLKSVSYGSGNERYMIISRKRTPWDLFNHIQSQGGSTNKYSLVPPECPE